MGHMQRARFNVLARLSYLLVARAAHTAVGHRVEAVAGAAKERTKQGTADALEATRGGAHVAGSAAEGGVKGAVAAVDSAVDKAESELLLGVKVRTLIAIDG